MHVHNAASADGSLIATLQSTSLVVRSATTAQPLHTYTLPRDVSSRCKFVRWFQPPRSQLNNSPSPSDISRILIASDDSVRIYDAFDPSWKATINNATSSPGAIADVIFGFSPDDIIVFSEFGVKATIWSLVTSRGVEIKDPKTAIRGRCFGHRPGTGHLALLTRPSTQDVLIIVEPGTRRMLSDLELSTVDAQDISWSPNGQWIAVLDTASVGHRVMIYTADGQLFRTWSGSQGDEIELGIRNAQWNMNLNMLALGDYNDTVSMLNHEAFTLLISLRHSTPLEASQAQIWEERLDESRQRSYAIAPQPAHPQTSESLSKSTPPKQGISIMHFSADGSILATKSDSTPTTVWIWSQSGKLIAALIHHSPVKRLAWHPKVPDLLLIHCAVSDPVVHLWRRSWSMPKALSVPAQETRSNTMDVSWLQVNTEDYVDISVGRVMLSTPRAYHTADFMIEDGLPLMPPTASAPAPFAEPEAAALSMGSGPEDMFDEGNSLDLSPIKLSRGVLGYGNDFVEDADDDDLRMKGFDDGAIDDTFHHRKKTVPGRNHAAPVL